MRIIPIIIQREYVTRIRKKSFILMTLLFPALIGCMFFLPKWLDVHDLKTKKIAVVDQTGIYDSLFQSNNLYHFVLLNQSDHLLPNQNEYDATLIISSDLEINPNGATIFSDKPIDPSLKIYLTQLLQPVKFHINLHTVQLNDKGEETTDLSRIALIIGMTTAIFIYFFLLVYGSQVMRGVTEEKNNRIVEVIISSVKPVQLMIGKIIGIALVGLTQFLIWMLLLFAIFSLLGKIPFSQIQEIVISLPINVAQTGFFFLLYFLGGYLLYASLFAAAGAASDNETDTQQFMLPIILPLIFGLFAAIYSTAHPDSSVAFWCSQIPFTSPIVMMARLPLGVPVWQLILSVTILIASFILMTYIAAKIYRIGILLYGKKLSYKEIWKWIKQK